MGALGGPPSPASGSGRVASVGGHWGRGSSYPGIGHADPVAWIHRNSSNRVCGVVDGWVGLPEGSVEKPACFRTSFLGVCFIEHDRWRGFVCVFFYTN